MTEARQLEEINSSGELASIKKDGTGAEKEVVTLEQVSNVDNTSDADKPISTSTQTALDLKLATLDMEGKLPALLQTADTLTGFDREDMDIGGKSLGILQFCFSAASGEVHQIGSDETGAYTKLTGQTHFADGSILADRTLVQYHDAGETQYSYWFQGALVEVTGSKSIQLTVGFDGYVCYDSDGELDDTVTDIRELIVRRPLVAYLYLNATNNELVWYADERHGIVMSGQSHLRAHQDRGLFIGSGLNISGIVNNGTTFAAISEGGAGDEDIKMFFSEITTIPKAYKEGAAGEWRISDDDSNLGIFRSAKCCYNLNTAGTWTLQEIDGDYVIMMPIATNNKLAPTVMLVGQTLHLTRGAARDNSPAEFFRIDAAGLPGKELKPLGSMIIHNEATGQIEVGADGEIYTICKHGFPIGIFS